MKKVSKYEDVPLTAKSNADGDNLVSTNEIRTMVYYNVHHPKLPQKIYDLCDQYEDLLCRLFRLENSLLYLIADDEMDDPNTNYGRCRIHAREALKK